MAAPVTCDCAKCLMQSVSIYYDTSVTQTPKFRTPIPETNPNWNAKQITWTWEFLAIMRFIGGALRFRLGFIFNSLWGAVLVLAWRKGQCECKMAIKLYLYAPICLYSITICLDKSWGHFHRDFLILCIRFWDKDGSFRRLKLFLCIEIYWLNVWQIVISIKCCVSGKNKKKKKKHWERDFRNFWWSILWICTFAPLDYCHKSLCANFSRRLEEVWVFHFPLSLRFVYFFIAQVLAFLIVCPADFFFLTNKMSNY